MRTPSAQATPVFFRIHGLVLLMLLAGAGTAVAQAAPDPSSELVSEARLLFEAGRFNEARVLLQLARGDRQDVNLLILEATCCENTGDIETAIALLESAQGATVSEVVREGISRRLDQLRPARTSGDEVPSRPISPSQATGPGEDSARRGILIGERQDAKHHEAPPNTWSSNMAQSHSLVPIDLPTVTPQVGKPKHRWYQSAWFWLGSAVVVGAAGGAAFYLYGR